MISNTCKYGIRALIYMAINVPNEGKVGIKKIAEDLDLPSPFLGKILQTIAKHKLLNSFKGPNGGFSFAKKPNEISLKEIVIILDGENFFNDCFLGLKICDGTPESKLKCPAHKKTKLLRENINDMFSKTTVGGLAAEIIQSGNQRSVEIYF